MHWMNFFEFNRVELLQQEHVIMNHWSCHLPVTSLEKHVLTIQQVLIQSLYNSLKFNHVQYSGTKCYSYQGEKGGL